MDEPDGSDRLPFPVDGDPAAGTPEIVPGAEHDPRIQAALRAPQNSAEIVAQHTGSTTHRGAPGRTDVTYGSGGLTGSVKMPGAANPLTGQRGLNAAPAAGEGEQETGSAARQAPQATRAPQAPAGGGPSLKKPGQDTEPEKPSLVGDLVQQGVDAGLYQLGQAADDAARAYTAEAPGAYDIAKNSKAGGRFLDEVQRSRLGKLLPGAFWDGFRGNEPGTADAGDAGQGKDGNDKSSGAGDGGKGSQRGKFKLAVAAGTIVLAPVVGMLLFLSLLLGVSASDGDQHTQPGEASDVKVAKYFPGGWQRLLKDAAQHQESSGTEDYATPPWTILAGIAAAQTDFARYSPYDNVDRDPGRRSANVPTGGSGGGGDAVVVGDDTDGAGPGPISGVTGAGSAASVGMGHPGPPPGDLGHQLGWFMWALRVQESGGTNGDYVAGKGKGGACGAYQYINSTWRGGYGGDQYPTACDAPPSIQDRRARRDIVAKFNLYRKWQEVAAAHFGGPAWATQTADWDRCPADCDVNPTIWEYVDDVMKKMAAAAEKYPDGSGGPAQPAAYRPGTGGTSGAMRTGTYADGCPVNAPAPAIGGKGGQGVGPYLLTPAAAGQMSLDGLDPQDPCEATSFVAEQLAKTAMRIHGRPDVPEWKPDGTLKDQEEARTYWSKVIEAAGIFVDRSANPDAPCAVPPPDDPKKPWSVSFKIITIWRCESTRMPDLYLVTGAQRDEKGRMRYTVESDRIAATETLVNEALSVSYGAGKWKTGKGDCDNDEKGRQGVFPMTGKEARAAGVGDRCDVDENIAGAAKLVLSGEKVEPEDRPHGRGAFEPMVGGWEKLGIAMGTDLDLFSQVGPGQGFTASDACTKVMTSFLTSIAPHASAFAELKDPPKADQVVGTWEPELKKLEKANGITDPGQDRACMAGSWSPGYNAQLAQIAAGLADGSPYSDDLDGLGNYYQAREKADQPTDPVAGQDTLVIPRLALRPLTEIGAPVAPDATDAWSGLADTGGVTIPLSQIAVEYAWFFGGVISPFDSAGRLIGSLANGSDTSGTPGTVQVSVGPDGCPENAPDDTLRQGAEQIGVHKLCADSVAKARTPEAAEAIKWALTHLGWPYSQAHRNDNGYADCSSFVSRAYRDSGAIPNLYPKGTNAPITTTFVGASWMHAVPLSRAQPGDLVEPRPGHVAMQLADGYKVHTNRTGDVSKVERAYPTAYWAGWVDPSKV